MNSVIMNAVASFFVMLWQWFKESAIGVLFFKICAAVSASWQKSAIMTALRRDERDYVNGSKLASVLKCPFTFLGFLKRKMGVFINENIKTSILCRWARVYLNNFIAMNTRFFGIMLACAGLVYTAAKLMTGTVMIAGVIATLIGGIFALMNFNVMKFLNNSFCIKFIKSCAGFRDLDLEAYCEEETSGVTRLVTAAAIGAVTGAMLAFSGILGAMVPFAVFGLLLVLWAPVTGVFAALFAAPFVPTMILAGLVLWTLLSLIIKSVSQENFKWKFDAVGAGIMLLLLILLISSALSFSRAGSLKVWAMYFVFVSFYFVIINSVDNEEQLNGLLKLFVISGAFVALYGVMQYVFGWTTSNAWIDEEMFENSTMRVYSTLGNPNVLGEYLLLVLPVAAGWFIKFKGKEIAKWTYAAMFLLLALCLVLTQSRGCWIGFMLAVVVFITFYEGKWWGLLPVVICALPFVLPETMVDRFLSIGNMNDSSTSYRVYIWLGTLAMLRYYWLGGIGMGEAAFNEVYPFFSYNAIQAPHSHNLYLQLTVEAGIAALIVFIAVQLILAKKMSDTYRMADKRDTVMSLAIGSGVIGFLAQSMFDYTFYNYRVMAVFFMVMAMGIAYWHIKKKEAVRL